jgi:hypothetical protein
MATIPAAQCPRHDRDGQVTKRLHLILRLCSGQARRIAVRVFEDDSAKRRSGGKSLRSGGQLKRFGSRLRASVGLHTSKKGAIVKELVIVRNLATLVFLFALLILLPPARADQANQATRVTFNQAVQIPGRVLPAGTYWFILPEDVNEHYQVRIFNADRTMLYATVFTSDAQRAQATGHGAFTFAERVSSQAPALVTWFYPGNTTGHEFLYPKQVEKELAKDKRDTVVAGD